MTKGLTGTNTWHSAPTCITDGDARNAAGIEACLQDLLDNLTYIKESCGILGIAYKQNATTRSVSSGTNVTIQTLIVTGGVGDTVIIDADVIGTTSSDSWAMLLKGYSGPQYALANLPEGAVHQSIHVAHTLTSDDIEPVNGYAYVTLYAAHSGNADCSIINSRLRVQTVGAAIVVSDNEP